MGREFFRSLPIGVFQEMGKIRKKERLQDPPPSYYNRKRVETGVTQIDTKRMKTETLWVSIELISRLDNSRGEVAAAARRDGCSCGISP